MQYYQADTAVGMPAVRCRDDDIVATLLTWSTAEEPGCASKVVSLSLSLSLCVCVCVCVCVCLSVSLFVCASAVVCVYLSCISKVVRQGERAQK